MENRTHLEAGLPNIGVVSVVPEPIEGPPGTVVGGAATGTNGCPGHFRTPTGPVPYVTFVLRPEFLVLATLGGSLRRNGGHHGPISGHVDRCASGLDQPGDPRLRAPLDAHRR